ncbi:hypothetical protein PTI98_000804 [Pleurotus ostreatus]|nr:hypothetical protein PTI98_000804 [Pleurotus ostreatus]
MILIDLPWYNEPGRGKANAKCQASIDYNKELANSTTVWAILDWLRDEHRNGIWADVIVSHFTIRSAQTRAHIARVATGNSGAGLVRDFDIGLKKLKKWDLSGIDP